MFWNYCDVIWCHTNRYFVWFPFLQYFLSWKSVVVCLCYQPISPSDQCQPFYHFQFSYNFRICFQEISNRTHVSRTPKKTWVSNSSIATYWTGSVGKVPFNFWWIVPYFVSVFSVVLSLRSTDHPMEAVSLSFPRGKVQRPLDKLHFKWVWD